MNYYLYLPDDDKDPEFADCHLLGTNNGFGTFWMGDAFAVLIKLLNGNNIDNIEIINDSNQLISLDYFSKLLESLKIKSK